MKRKNIKKAGDMTVWNYDNPMKKQFTKKEHKNAEGMNAEEAREWNEYLPSAEQYTKAEHQELLEPMEVIKIDCGKNNSVIFSVAEKLDWNTCLPNAEQYTKKEHYRARTFNTCDMTSWNINLPNAEQYTEKDINEVEVILYEERQITKEIFKNWKELIKFRFEVTSYNHLMRKLKAKNI